MANKEKVIIFDTTLRDGEQSAGAGLTVDEKKMIALQLEKLGVDIIEAGFAASSPGDFQAVRKISKELKKATVASLARVIPSDIEAAAKALEVANKPRIHTFVSSSSIHMEHQMRKDPEEILEMAVVAVKKAKHYVDDVEFSPMDATRTDIDFLITLLEATIDAGATTINIPDTVGYGIPNEFGNLIKRIYENVSNLGNTIISVHCHNDLGLAVSNSLAAVENGARQIEGCINGLGERAGNASIEELVMGLETRKDYFGVSTSINTSEIGPTSRLVSNLFGFPLQANKAIVGQNAFRHSSGIHQDAFLKDRSTFEIMEPDDVGWRGEALVLGKLSGRAGLRSRLQDLGYELNDEELLEIFSAFKILADQKKEITDLDLESLMAEHNRTVYQGNLFEIQSVEVKCGNTVQPKATVEIKVPEGINRKVDSIGTGPVDAVCKAIDKIVEIPVNLTEFSVNAVTQGIDSLGEVTIRISDDMGQIFSGRGSDSDIVVSSAKAYLNAINRMIMIREEGTDSPTKK
jgi:2-isopropylmalate synthase